MRIAIPHMGNLHIAFKAMCQRLGVDFVAPPVNSQRTLSLGVKYSPEGLCLPFKLILGNIVEAAGLGADTVLMPIGYGICRLGYYAKMQEKILHDLGYNTKIVTMGVSERKLLGLLNLMKYLSGNAPLPRLVSAFRFGMAKLQALDTVERLVQKIRPVEREKGSANKLYNKTVEAIDRAEDYRDLKAQKEYLTQLEQLVDENKKEPLIVGITGEFYVLLEPFANLDLERELGKLGVEVRRTTFISDWTKFSLFLNPLGLDEKSRIHRAAMPYLKRDVGGDGWESVGEKVLHAGEYDGLVHLAPFTCMPEIVAENIMRQTREKMPVLTILCDEQLAKPGLLTRLEAFVDLLKYRRQSASGAGAG